VANVAVMVKDGSENWADGEGMGWACVDGVG